MLKGIIQGTGRHSHETVEYDADCLMLVAITPDDDAVHKNVQFSVAGSGSDQDLMVMMTALMTALHQLVGDEKANKIIEMSRASVADFKEMGGQQ